MPRPELLGDITIVFRALIGIADHQLDRRAGGFPFIDPGEDFHLIGLAPLRGVFVLARFPPVEPVLQPGGVNRHARWAAIHRRAKRGTVAFTPGGDAEEMAECIE